MEEKRLEDLAFLNRYYESGLTNILVVYGHRNTAYKELLLRFMENRRSFYFSARSVSEREQLFLWGNELKAKSIEVSKYPTYTEILENCIGASVKVPTILVIDSFEYAVRASKNFMEELTSFVDKNGRSKQILVILLSQDINWVENSMVSSLGNLSAKIAGFRKIKPLPFSDLRAHFPNMSYKDAVLTYSILGGQTGLWRYFDDKYSFKENVCKNIIDEASFLHGEPYRLTEYNLRETAVYHTILSQMARGVNKLNDLYHATGFSRAKISVYLKTLIHHDLAIIL